MRGTIRTSASGHKGSRAALLPQPPAPSAAGSRTKPAAWICTRRGYTFPRHGAADRPGPAAGRSARPAELPLDLAAVLRERVLVLPDVRAQGHVRPRLSVE